MTISNTNYHTADMDILRALRLNIRMFFYSFMDYCDQEIARQMNVSLEYHNSPVRVDVSLVAEVRAGRL